MAWFWSSTDHRPAPVVLLLLLLCAAGSGCTAYLHPERVRAGAEVAVPPPSARAQVTGSLWRDNVSANFLFTDVRARFPGDLLTVLVLEDSSGSKEADTSTSTKTSVSGNLREFFGLPQELQKKNPNINPEQLIEASAARDWEAEGSTSRKGKLTARMTAEVTKVAANGNLWIEGEKVVAVNKEDQHIVVSGWVRPEDINAQNEVLSTRLASGRIEYYGAGVVGQKQRPGWGLMILDLVWPF